MRRLSQVSFGFKKAKPADKVKFGSGVVKCLSGPTALLTYPNLPIPVADLEAVTLSLNNAVVADQSTGSRQSRTALKNAVADWVNTFGLTGSYINMVAQGNDQTIADAGFLSTKTNSHPRPKPSLAADFQATINGFKGAILAGCKTPVHSAAAYAYYALPNGASVTFSENTMIITMDGKSCYVTVATQKKVELYNLPSTTTFKVGMYAINGSGAGPATGLQEVTTQ